MQKSAEPNAVEHELLCPDCGSKMKLRQSRYGLFYGCTAWPACKGTHGAHASGAPLGIPATKQVKEARIQAHSAFDQLWKSGRMKRGEAYTWLAKTMGMTKEEAHIGRFNAEQCERLQGLLRAEAIDSKAQEDRLCPINK